MLQHESNREKQKDWHRRKEDILAVSQSSGFERKAHDEELQEVAYD